MNVVVTRSGGTSAPQNVTVAPASPGIFTTTANGLGQAFAYDNTTGALAAPGGAAVGSFTHCPHLRQFGYALIVACTGLGSVTPSIDDYVAASDGILRYTLLTALRADRWSGGDSRLFCPFATIRQRVSDRCSAGR